MSLPRPPIALLLAALVLILVVAGTATRADADARAARPHGPSAAAAGTANKGFSHRRAHGGRGLSAPSHRSPAARRPAAPTAPALPSAASVPVSAAPGPADVGLALPALPALTAPLVADTAGTGTAQPAVPAPAAATLSTLGVQTFDTPGYRMLLSRAGVVAGPVRLQLRNGGEDPHNLLLTRTDGTGEALAVPLTAPGTTRTTTVQLTPGTYRLVCTLTAPVVHATAGMQATLSVTALP